jgi:hypothetical protein
MAAYMSPACSRTEPRSAPAYFDCKMQPNRSPQSRKEARSLQCRVASRLRPTSLDANHKRTTQPRGKRIHIGSATGLSVAQEASKVRDSFMFLRDLLSRKRFGASRTAFRELRDNINQTSKTSLSVVWPRRACSAARQDARFGFAFPQQ